MSLSQRSLNNVGFPLIRSKIALFFFSNNFIISPNQDLSDCKLLRAAGNGVPFAAMIRESRSHVTFNDTINKMIITRTSDFLAIHGMVFCSERIQERTRNSVGIRQC